MRVWIIALLFLFMILSASGLKTSLSCPDEVNFNEEFTCTVNVNEVTDIYDLKIYIKGDSGGINRIWEDGEFRRADWYLKEFIEEDGEYNVKLIIHKEDYGNAKGEFKLRDSSGKIVTQKEFNLDVFNSQDSSQESETTKDDEENTEETNEESNQNEENKQEVVTTNTIANTSIEEIDNQNPKKVINLNKQGEIEEQVIYKSKNEKVKDYIIYAFIVFLILIIGVLLFERKNGKSNNDY